MFAAWSIVFALLTLNGPGSRFFAPGAWTVGTIHRGSAVLDVPAQDRHRKALAVFLRFRDDLYENTGCTSAAEQWSAPDELPSVSEFVLAEDSVPPFDARSLTDYFFQQSNGNLVLFGQTYPSVVVTEYDEREYGLYPSNTVDLGLLAREVITTIDSGEHIDLSEFDANDDGIVDYVFLIVRRLSELKLTPGNAVGVAHLGFSSPKPEFGDDPENLKGVRDWMSGAHIVYLRKGNVFPRVNLLRLMAHEFSHGLRIGPPLELGGLNAIGGEYGVPSNDTGCIGYLLMAQNEDVGGSCTMGALERDLIKKDWIDCRTLEDNSTVEVRDLYSESTNNCYRVIVGRWGAQQRTLYISNRQRIGPFDTLMEESCGGTPSDHGLMTTGLLVTILDDERHVAVLAADDSLELGVASETYQGDMFGPNTKTQLTPWTRPNINGYSGYPPGVSLTDGDFQALDSIRYQPDQDEVMVFEYVADFRAHTVFREDSWIGGESRGVVLAGSARLTNESCLEVSTEMRFDGELVLESASTLEVTETAALTVDSLRLAEDATLIVDGLLTVESHYDCPEGATVQIGPSGALIVGIEDSGDDLLPTAFALHPIYPNPFNRSTRITYGVAQPMHITLAVYDALGREVQVLASGARPAGTYEVEFNAEGLPSGVYFCRLEAGDFSKSETMVLSR